jgi:putative FmdB family regulatory protein
MPTYSFRCEQDCPDFTAQFPMTAIPDQQPCPGCGSAARRRIGNPSLGAGDTSAMRLHDATRASADNPAVVKSLPASSRRTPVTTDPLHRRLPRP